MRNVELEAIYSSPSFATRTTHLSCGAQTPHSNETSLWTPTGSHECGCAVHHNSGHVNNSPSGDSWRWLFISCCLIEFKVPPCAPWQHACTVLLRNPWHLTGSQSILQLAAWTYVYTYCFQVPSVLPRRTNETLVLSPSIQLRGSQSCRVCVVKCNDFNELLYAELVSIYCF
jgi:hypothetical protein